MITRLEIENFVFVEKIVVSFSAGLNVFTGETGAGKSMIFRALAVGLGEKASIKLLRVGASFLRVSLSFSNLSNLYIKQLLTSLGVSDWQNITIDRVVTAEGKSKVLVSGMPITVSELQELAPYLLDVHSQHQQQYLLDPSTHILYYDAFAGLKNLRLQFEQAYVRWKKIKKELEELQQEKSKALKEKDFLQFQYGELEAATISKEEYEDLKKKLANYVSREARTNAYFKMEETLSGTALEGVNSIGQQLNAQLSRDIFSEEDIEEMAAIKSQTDAVQSTLQDISASLQRKIERFDFLKAIDAINQKLAKVESLMRKQGITIDALWQKYEEIGAALDKIKNDDGAEEEIAARLRVCERDVIKMALTLHVRRKEAVDLFEEQVLEEISYLGMQHAALKVFLTPKDLMENISEDKIPFLASKISPYGLSKLEFLYSSASERNPERLKKIISGGELSRLMLSLKVILSEKIPVNTMVFDEVDTGIGGDIASHVGEKLKQLAEKKQVVVITHLAQIARFANAHYMVDRSGVDANKVVVKQLKENEVKAEISRMLGGSSYESGGMLASEMLGDAKNN